MCGICGIILPDRKPPDEKQLQAMAETMVHRGPDDEGVYSAAGAGLAFRRLSIIDLDGSHQPLSNEDESLHLVCNGEIYNYIALREQLVAKGHAFRTQGDAEVLLHAYEEWGDDFLAHIHGMFAFALWDEDRERLLLARDRLGIKPLFYTHHNGQLLFGSELKAIMAHADAPRDIDHDALNTYLSLNYIPAPRTIYRGIHKLMPGVTLSFDRKEVRTTTYWTAPAPAATWQEQADVSRLQTLLREATADHLQSDVPVAYFLSGGMDSSALVAMAAEVSSTPPTTFSIGFETHSHNELPYARELAHAYNCEHHEEMVHADAAAILPSLVAAFDEPFADPSAVPTYYISKIASQHVKVVMGGDGGDELFAGYEWTRRQRYIDLWRKAPSWIRHTLQATLEGEKTAPGRIGQMARFINDAQLPDVSGYARRMSGMTPTLKHELYHASMKSQVPQDPARELFDRFFTSDAIDTVSAMNQADLHIYLPDDILCKVDRMTMLNSLEGRVPLLDDRVVDFALRLPMEAKLHGFTSKYILKEAMHDLLPPAIRRQRKHGFAPPVGKWMREDLYASARRILLSKEASERGFFDETTIDRMLQSHRNGTMDYGYPLWTLLNLELWFRVGFGRSQSVMPHSLHDIS